MQVGLGHAMHSCFTHVRWPCAVHGFRGCPFVLARATGPAISTKKKITKKSVRSMFCRSSQPLSHSLSLFAPTAKCVRPGNDRGHTPYRGLRPLSLSGRGHAPPLALSPSNVATARPRQFHLGQLHVSDRHHRAQGHVGSRDRPQPPLDRDDP